jgi:hypothetical protein
VAVAGLPLIQPRLRPWRSTVRRRSSVQPVDQPGVGVELDAHVQALGAFAHGPGIGPVAQGELQSVDQYGFAGAGLAGQHGEACGQIDVERAHDHEVAQGDASQCHQRSWKYGSVVTDEGVWKAGMVQEPPSFQCSFLRSVSK